MSAVLLPALLDGLDRDAALQRQGHMSPHVTLPVGRCEECFFSWFSHRSWRFSKSASWFGRIEIVRSTRQSHVSLFAFKHVLIGVDWWKVGRSGQEPRCCSFMLAISFRSLQCPMLMWMVTFALACMKLYFGLATWMWQINLRKGRRYWFIIKLKLMNHQKITYQKGLLSLKGISERIALSTGP